MRITITGSLGHISKPLTEELLQKGHAVTVISHNPQKQKDIEALGASAAIGSIEDLHFLTTAFKGTDAVYTMLPPPDFSNPDLDFMGRAEKIASNYVQAIQQSGVKRVVHLSSVGAHTNKDNGLLLWAHTLENILSELSADTAITFMRPVGFYYNLLSFINGIKTQNVIASNYGAEDIIPWVSPNDIATAIAEEIAKPFAGRKIFYVASDELSCNETASILGTAIKKPDLKWIVISDEQLLSGMKAFGLNGKVKLKDFTKEFAAAFK